MKIGFHLPQVGEVAGRDAVLDVARCAEEHGLASVWVGDHVAFPASYSSSYPYSRDGVFPLPPDSSFLEALTTLAVVAGATERIAVGTSVLVAPMRETIALARQVATLAHLAPGRVILGVGAGWLREEFEVVGVPFDDRGPHLDDQLAAMRGLWSEAPYAHAGPHVAFPPVYVEPRPDPLPKIWIGGNGKAALRRSGRFGDAWHAAGSSDLAAGMAVVRDAAEAAGRDPGAVELTARTGLSASEKGWASLLERLDRLAGDGCAEVIVSPAADTKDELLRLCAKVAALVGRW